MIENELYECLYDDNGDIVEDENKEFIIDNAEKAMWGLNKIKELRAERDFYVDACKIEIDRLKNEIQKAEDKCDRNTNWFIFKLNEYLDRDDVPSKTTKTQKALKLPNGSIVRKLPKIEIVDKYGNVGAKLKTNEDLISSISDEYKKVTTEVNWGELKKHLIVSDGIVMTDEGEVIDCLDVRETLPTVDVKF